ncbi:unnamed protein product [Caenorhabditis brenneri]
MILIVLFSVAGRFAERQMFFDGPPSSSKKFHLVSPKQNDISIPEKHKWRRNVAENHRFIDAEPECRTMEDCGFGMVCNKGECVGITF